MFIRLGDIYVDPFKVQAIMPQEDAHKCLLAMSMGRFISINLSATSAAIRIEDALEGRFEENDDFDE